jgi:hypothetical protein
MCLHQEDEHLRLMQEHLARRKAMAKRTQVMQQQIKQERVAHIELQRAIEHLHQQEHEPSVQEPPLEQHQPQQPPQKNTSYQPRQNNIDSKCPLANNLQLASWPLQYRVAPLPKYYRESDPPKFLMSYEVAIASFVGDETTLAKSFIISLENAAANWYARLPPRSITSWPQLKEKLLVNFQGFQADVSTKEDFFSCQQYKRETLPDFFRRFLRLKAQALEVSNEQARTQVIKALRVGQLHSHLVREHPRTLEELYDEFRKFCRAEVLHFHKLV